MRSDPFHRFAKAIQFDRGGAPEVLRVVEDRLVARPKSGQLLVRVRAAGLNPIDCRLRRSGMMRLAFGLRTPVVPGFDFAGEVVEVGPGVRDYSEGDSVLGMLRLREPGAYAEYLLVSADLVVKKPAAVSFEAAAALPLAGLTAYQLLKRSRKLEKGARVLINGASGGVGSFAVQIAKANGALVTAVTSGRNLEMSRSLGADFVVDYTSQNVVTGGPYDAVVDTVGNVSFWRARRALERTGSYVSCAQRPGMLVETICTQIGGRKARLGIVKPNAADLAILIYLLETGRIRAVIERTFELEEIVAAHRHLESNRTRGKLILRVRA